MTINRRPVFAAILTLGALSGAATASSANATSATPWPTGGPQELPGAVARSFSGGSSGSWILGVKPGAKLPAELKSQVNPSGLIVVPASQARAVAARLGKSLSFSEPDSGLRSTSVLESDPSGWARGTILSSNDPDRATTPAIGVVDDTIDTTHPDLSGHVTNLNNAKMDSSHGTSVATIASASRGGGDLLGVAPGAKILGYGVSGEIKKCTDVVTGIRSTVAAGARVVNLSLASPKACYSLYVEIQRAISKGVTVIAAAGNEFAHGDPVMYPAAFPHIISIAAVTKSNLATDFSSSGTDVDLSAPGENVPLGLVPSFNGGRYGIGSGTSFAAPMVAGAAQRLIAAKSNLRPDQVMIKLASTATDIGATGWDKDTGWGLVNLDKAQASKTPRADPQEVNDEIAWVDGTLTGKVKPYIWTGSKPRTITARIDKVEDPEDVYRISIPARRTARLTLNRTAGSAPRMTAYSNRATSINQSTRIVKRSRDASSTRRTLSVRNSARIRRVFYIRVQINSTTGALNGSYTLNVK